MLCRELSLVNYGEGYAIALPLRCRSWGCEYCQPERRREVVALAISGHANRFVTLTCRPSLFGRRERRAAEIAAAWRIVVKRLRRQFALAAEKRFPLRSRRRSPEEIRQLQRRLEADDSKNPATLEYLAVFEAHKSGEPHLHILARSRYIDQAWLSEQMDELISSPVCDVRICKDVKGAAGYLSKYMGKAPHKFGTCKRYWHTKNWSAPDDENRRESPWVGLEWKVVDKPIEEVVKEWIEWGHTIDFDGHFDIAWHGRPPPRLGLGAEAGAAASL